jgi:PAS domain S-box-containing protein
VTAPPAPDAPPTPGASPLALAHAALLAADRAAAPGSAAPGAAGDARDGRDGALDGVIAALLDGVRALGFDRALLVARDARGEDAGMWTGGAAAPPAFGAAVWRRWIRLLDRRRASLAAESPEHAAGWWSDLAADAWARAEFGELFGIAPGGAAGGPEARGLFLAAAPDAGDGMRVVLAAERDGAGASPGAAVEQAAAFLARAAAGHLGRARLGALAAARAERLRRLHEAGVALARSLDEGEVVAELAQQVARLVPHDGLVVAHPDVARGRVRTALRLVRGAPRPLPEAPLRAGPIGEAARTGAPVRVDEYDPARSPLAADDDVVGDAGPARSVLAVPMRAGPHLVGVLAVHAAAPGAFGDAEEELLRTVATQAAVALANARAFAESEAERRQGEALVALARAVGGSRRQGEVLRLGLGHTLALLGAEGAFVALVQGAHLHVVAGAGAAELFAGALLAVADTLPGRAVAGGAAVIENRVPAAGHAAFPLHDVAPVQKLVAVPLVTADGAVGVLAAVNRGDDFAAADARVLGRLAELLAVAAVNARLFASVEEATREWRVAFDATGAGMAVVDVDGRVSRANVRAAELLAGAPSPRPLLGADFVALVCGDGPGAVESGTEGEPGEAFGGGSAVGAAALREALGAGERRRGRVRVRAAGGGAGRVFEALVSPHPAGGVVVTFDDVTAQVALAERHRLVVETTRDALLITSREGAVLYANPAAVALFGRGDALVGTAVSSLVHPDERREVVRLAGQTRLREPLGYEFTTVRPDGTERRLAVSTSPLRELGDAGPASGVVASVRDVTDERAAQAAARVWTDRYARLVDAASDGIMTVDAAGRVTSANAAAAAAVGTAPARLAGRHCADLVDPRDRERLGELVAAALAGRRARGEVRYRDRRGRSRVASVTAGPVGSPDGTPAALGIVRDVSEERRTAEQLVQREKLAAMGQLVSGVAHELNNPLAGVLALSELLLAEPVIADPPDGAFLVEAATRRELREVAAATHREARRAARTVSRLLDFARQHAPRRAGRRREPRARRRARPAARGAAAGRRRPGDRARLRAAGGVGRRAPAPAGVPEPDRQRGVRARRPPGPAPAGPAHAGVRAPGAGRPAGDGRGDGAVDRRRGVRQRAGARPAPRRARVRTVLHDQARGRGDGARARRVVGHRARARRRAARRERARRGRDVRRRAAGGRGARRGRGRGAVTAAGARTLGPGAADPAPVDLGPFGLALGHATDAEGATGCTVVRGADRALRAAHAVLGRASATRELAVASPEHLVGRADAVLLAGGSAYGLDAAAGVMRWMEERGRGFPVGPAGGVVPIVPAAALFDLLPLGRFDRRPTPAMAYEACERASPLVAEHGSVGAGTGATVGRALGPGGLMKGGVGAAAAWEGAPGEAVGVAAIAAVNALGDVRDAAGRVLAGARRPDGSFAGDAPPGRTPPRSARRSPTPRCASSPRRGRSTAGRSRSSRGRRPRRSTAASRRAARASTAT